MPAEDEQGTDEHPTTMRPDPEPPRPPPQPVRADFGALSDRGRVRATNQDHFLIARISRSFRVLESNLPDGELAGPVEDVGYIMAVADGMGGMAAGERASMLAIRTGVRLILKAPRWVMKVDAQEARALVGRMREYLRKVDRAVVEQAEREPGLLGMGTTLTWAYSVGADAFLVHAGDSRAYLYRGGALRRLTRDHTLAQRLADSGEITPEEVPAHPGRHVLTNYVGGPVHGIDPEVYPLELADGDRLLLCSDGLTRMVADPEIAAVLGAHDDPRDAAQALTARALDRGGRDNVTVLVARYAIPGAGPPGAVEGPGNSH